MNWLNKLLGWRTWKDRLSLMLVVGIPFLWIWDGAEYITLDEHAMGATILAYGLVIQNYFKKDIKDEEPPAPKPEG